MKRRCRRAFLTTTSQLTPPPTFAPSFSHAPFHLLDGTEARETLRRRQRPDSQILQLKINEHFFFSFLSVVSFYFGFAYLPASRLS